MATTADGAIPEIPLFGEETQLINFFNQLFGTENSGTTTTAPGPEGQNAFQLFLQQLMPTIQSDQYSPESAERDAKGLVDLIFQNFKEGALPQIYQAQNASGGYNSTTAQLLANDAQARAVQQGALVTQKTKTDYADIRQKNMQMLMNTVIAMLNASRRQTTQQTNNQSSDAAKKAALAAQAAKAMQNKGAKGEKKKPPKFTNTMDPRDIRSDEEWLRDTQGSFTEGMLSLQDQPPSEELQALLDQGTATVLGDLNSDPLMPSGESLMPDLSFLDNGGLLDLFETPGFGDGSDLDMGFGDFFSGLFGNDFGDGSDLDMSEGMDLGFYEGGDLDQEGFGDGSDLDMGSVGSNDVDYVIDEGMGVDE